MEFKKQKRNAPIVTLIRNYVNKNSGKVTGSRKEIQRRFFGLDWKHQKKIMDAFLDSGSSDQDWAYSRLLDLWDESFEQKVLSLWNEYHEEKCSWVIIRHFPVTYLQEHLDQLSEGRNYYFICLRLAKDDAFVIDRSKLTDLDYLSLVCHTERDITDDEARDVLYAVVHDSCMKESFFNRLEQYPEGRYPEVITPANYREIHLARYYLMRLEKTAIVRQFEQWIESVEETIYNSPEFKSIDNSCQRGSYEYDYQRVEISNIYSYLALDDKYKQATDPTTEQMRQSLEQRRQWSPSDLNATSYDGEESLPF